MMKNFMNLLIVFFMLVQCSPETNKKSYNAGIHIIPQPKEITLQKDFFMLNSATKVVVKNVESELTSWMLDKIEASTGFKLRIVNSIPHSNYILLDNTNKSLGKEAYELTATSDDINIQSSTSTGLFYALQTLFQLFPAEIESPTFISSVAWKIPAIKIKDEPRFSHRGVMIDVCRHFYKVEALKKQIEIMAMLKLNVLHLHLTEHQAWRIEIKKYPRLVAIGAKGDMCNGKTYGPYFYTQEQIKEIVAYAQKYHIEVIPEIEFPGHCLAALAAYPEYSCTGGPFKSNLIFGYEIECFCVGKDATFHFFEDILREISALFPSKYIHIGGDECAKKRWSECPDCQARIRKLHLKKNKKYSAEEQLQSYAIHRIEKFVSDSLGKKMIGWDEILEGGLAPGAVVMSWRGVKGGISAAQSGHDVIMAPMVEGLYMCDGQGAVEVEPATSGRIALMQQLYHYEPIPKALTENEKRHILGTEICLWTEWANKPSLFEYMLYPRAVAAAEVNWSEPERKDWNDFQRRLENIQVRLDMHKVQYHIPLPEGVLTQNIAFIGDSTVLKFTNTRSLPMVYTLDATKPTAKSPVIDDSLVIKKTTQLQIATLLSSGKLSKVRSILVEKQQPQKSLNKKQDKHIRLRIADGYFLTEKDYPKAKFHTDTLIESFKAYNKDKYQYTRPQLAYYEGEINVPETGVYTFSTNADELWINGQRLIYNETCSRFYAKKHQFALEKGVHIFKLSFNNIVKEGFANCWQEIGFRYQLPSGEIAKR